MPRKRPLDPRRIYYCYALFDWLGIPRWIGKGKGSRETDHEKRSDPGNWQKNEFIEQTWLVLGEIPKVRIRDNVNEAEALNIEIALIKAIGRFPNGPLLNRTDGGEGLAGHVPTRSHRRAISEAKTGNPNQSASWPWITNGTNNKKLRPGQELPDNWRLGRTPTIRMRHEYARRLGMSKPAYHRQHTKSQTPKQIAASERRRGVITPAMAAANERQRGRKFYSEKQFNGLQKRREKPTSQKVRNVLLHAAHRVWITNCQENKRIYPNEELPIGWKRGRTFSPVPFWRSEDRSAKVKKSWITRRAKKIT